MPTFNRLSSYYYRCIGIIAIIFATTVLASVAFGQRTGPSESTNPAASHSLALDPEKLVATVADVGVPFQDRLAAFQGIWSLPPEIKTKSLKALLTADETFASPAAAELVREGEPNLYSLVENVFPQWHGQSQATLLYAILITPDVVNRDPELLILCRGLLEKLPPNSSVDEDLQAYNCASQLLVRFGEAGDLNLVKTSVLARPEIEGFWIAILDSNNRIVIDDKLIGVAKIESDNPKERIETRLAAAAVAASAGDIPTKTFICDYEAKYCATFANQDVMSLVNIKTQAARDQYVAFRSGIGSIGLIAAIPDARLPSHLIDLLNADNIEIRLTAAIVLARKWPKDLLIKGPCKMGNDEYADIMAELVSYHPELRPDVIAKGASGQQLDKNIAKIKMNGISSIFYGLGVGDFGY